MRSITRLALPLLVAVVAACSADTTDRPTAPLAETTAVAATEASPAVRLPEAGEPWDVLFLADQSDPLSETVRELYQQLAQDSLGVEIRVLPGPPYPAVKDLLGHLRDERFPFMSDPVRESEIIVVQIWPRGLEVVESEDFDRCRYPSAKKPPPDVAAFTPENWTEYREILGEIYTEIWRLREGVETVLIGVDYYNPWASAQREAGNVNECRVMWESWSNAQRDVGEAYGARWVSLYDLLHGPDHDVDPLEVGYLGPSAQMPNAAYYLPNEVGAALIAAALAAAGFEPSTQP